MSIRVKYNIDLSLSESAAGAKELGSTPPLIGTNDQMDDGGSFRRRVLAAAVDVPVDINGLSVCRLLMIKSTKTITVKKNSSGGEAWTVRALGVGATDAIMIMTTDGVTSLYISNPGTEDAEVTFVMAGTIA